MRQVEVASRAWTSRLAQLDSSLQVTIAALGRSLCKGLIDTYRPERHYMRGPGPKCRDKARATAGSIGAHPFT